MQCTTPQTRTYGYWRWYLCNSIFLSLASSYTSLDTLSSGMLWGKSWFSTFRFSERAFSQLHHSESLRTRSYTKFVYINFGMYGPPIQWVPSSFPGGKAAGAWRWPPIHIKLRGYRKSRSVPVLPLWAFMTRLGRTLPYELKYSRTVSTLDLWAHRHFYTATLLYATP
jgi:hypothetical protein